MEKIKVTQLKENPNNPRKELGDLAELTESIKVKGILQNLTVVPDGEDYMIVIGHRRAAAAKAAGLAEVPCLVTEMSEKEQLEVMLLENIQRNELTPYEQAQGFQLMIDLGSTEKEIAEATGFSRKTVKRRLELAKLPEEKLKQTQLTLTQCLDLDQLKSLEDREKVLDDVAAGLGSFERNLFLAVRRQAMAEQRAEVLELLEKKKATERKANSWDRDVCERWWVYLDKVIDEEMMDKIIKCPEPLYWTEGYENIMIYQLKEVTEEEHEESREEKLERARRAQIDQVARRVRQKIINFADAVTPEQAESERVNIERTVMELLKGGARLSLDLDEGGEESLPWILQKEVAKDLANEIRWVYNWQHFQKERAEGTDTAYVLLSALGYETDEEELDYLDDKLPEPEV